MNYKEKEQEDDTSNVEFDKSKLSRDYKYLVQKLKSIRKNINLLEKNFFEKEI